MDFEAGQIFEGEYPPEAAIYCNEAGDRYITEIESKADGTRRFQIMLSSEKTQAEKDAELLAYFTAVLQNHLDAEARKLGYDSCLSVCSYVDTGVPKFDAEGQAFRQWRSAVWQKGYAIVAAVKAGEREVPSEAELLAEIPLLSVSYSTQAGAENEQ